MLPDEVYQVAERSHNRCTLANLQFHEQLPEEKKEYNFHSESIDNMQIEDIILKSQDL